MVEHGAIQRFGRRRQAARRAAIGLARAGIAARMIVGKDDPGAAMLRRVDDEVSKLETRAGLLRKGTGV